MTTVEIDAQIMGEYQKFENAIHKGVLDVPHNIVTLFINGCMALAHNSHKIHATRIKVIANTPYDELTNGDIQEVIKIIINTPPEKLYPISNFLEAIDSEVRFQKFIISYNNAITEFQKNLEQKKKMLASLSQGVPSGNSMKIVPR